MSEEEIKARIEAVDREVAKAKDNVARIEGKLEELDREKEQILAGFKEIGVPPQEAKAKREALEADIEKWLDEAEQIIADSKEQSNG